MLRWNSDLLYRFIFADVANRASVVRNSVRHDLRYARYLRAGGYSAAQKEQLESAIRMLTSIDKAFGDAVVGRATTLAESDEPIDQASFNNWRAEITRQFRAAYARESVLYGHLRATSDHLPPDVTFPWTRLETTDSSALGFIETVARQSAAEACSWAARLVGRPVEPLVAVELAHFSEVVSHEARDPVRASSRDGFLLQHAVQVPFHFVYLFRYAPLIVHEACHPSVRLVLSQGVPGKFDLNDKIGLFGASMRDVVDFGPTPREREIVLASMATEALIESVVDEMAYRIAGPGYVLALVCWLLGRTAEASELSLDYALPVGTRIRRLMMRIGPDDAVGIEGFVSALGQDVKEFDRRLKSMNPAYTKYRDALLRLVSSDEWSVPELHTVGASEESRQLRSVLARLWVDALRGFERAQPEQRVPTLARLREGRTVAQAFGPVEEPELAFDEVTWRMLRFHLRKSAPGNLDKEAPAPAGLRETCQQLATAVQKEGRAHAGLVTEHGRLAPEGMVGAVLGPADLIVLVPGPRTREEDGVDQFVAALPNVQAYAVRRLVLRVKRVGPVDAPLYDWRKAPTWRPDLMLVSDISLDMDSGGAPIAGPSQGVRYLRDVLASLSARDDVWPWAIFRGFGWANFTIVVGLRGVAPLHALRDRVLTDSHLAVQRSISSLMLFPQEVGEHPVAAAPPGQPSEAVAARPLADGPILRVAHRVTRAASISALIGALRPGQDAAPVPRPRTIQPTLGLHDLHADYALESVEIAEAVAELGWRLQGDGLVTRSVTSLVLDDQISSR